MRTNPPQVPDGGRGSSQIWVEAILAAAAFAALCLAVLSVAPQAAEPDDGAYRASIVAMTDGHFLTLSAAQAEAMARQLDDNPAAPPNQWVELANGRYISEKDPGYPFLAAPFQALGISAGLRCSTARWPAWGCLRRTALARTLRRVRRGGPVLLIRSRAGLRLARLHADVH